MYTKQLLFIFIFYLIQVVLFAQPGKNGALTVNSTSQVVNLYSPVTGSIAAGSSTLTAVLNSTFFPLCTGDLIMIYQAQGASMNTTNTVNYGDITAYNSAGLYEFKYVQSVSGNTITVQTTFTNTYSLAGKPQVVKVPQYTMLTINTGASIVSKPWQDTSISSIAYRFRGLVVIHAQTIVNNGTITASGSGFRGGKLTLNTYYINGTTDYVSSFLTHGGEKGEGICGYQTDYDLNGGRYCRGACANGGGGGDATNSSGGGGSNGYNGNAWTGQGVMIVNATNANAAWALDPDYIVNSNALTNSSGGGRGGYSWSYALLNLTLVAPGNTSWLGDSRREVGGLGGRPLTNIDADTRIYFGGGGGAPDGNDNAGSDGASGGGIVYLIATTGISGNGLIESGGNTAANSVGCSCDGIAGGGAGGSIVIKTGAIVNSQTVAANGGKGGSKLPVNNPSSINESQGSGGGGGGGFVAISAGAIIPSINGGLNGIILSPPTTASMTSNGGTQGATGQTGTVSASFIPFVPMFVGTNSPVCAGSPLNFTTTGGYLYNWTGPNNFSSSVQNPTLVNTTSLMSGTYSLTTTQGTCTMVPVTQTLAVSVITINGIVSASNPGCNGNSNGSATMTASGVTGSAAYSWTTNTGTQTTSAASGLSAGFYTATVTDSGSPCFFTQSFQISQPPPLTLSISGSFTACAGNSLSLTAIALGGTPGYTYIWVAGPSSASYNPLPTNAGGYVYTVTSADANSCAITQTISTVIYALPPVAAASASVCPNTTASLTATGAGSYFWHPGNIGSNPAIITSPSTIIYTVTGTDAVTGCTANATATLLVYQLPALSFSPAAITCASLGSATVMASGGTGPYSYSWAPTAQTTSIATGLYPGTYTLAVQDNFNNCISTSTTNFAPLIPFTGTVSATSSFVCNGASTGTAAIALSGGSGSQSYAWSNFSGIESSIQAANLNAGTHTVTVIDALTFCTVTQTFVITQPPAVSLTVVASTPTACTGASITLYALGSGGTPGYAYSWAGGISTATRTVSPANGGTYSYSVFITDAYGCSAYKTISVIFISTPTVSVSSATICATTIATLTASGANTYTWSAGALTGTTFTISAPASAFYMVTGNISGCSASGGGSVIVNPLPSASVIVSPTVCSGQSIFLSGGGNGNYLWAGPSTFTSTLQNPIAPAHAGTYYLTVTSAQGCTASASASVSVLLNPVISVSGATVCAGEPALLSASGGGSYVWTGPAGNVSNAANVMIAVVNASTAGSYTVVVTGSNSCSTYSVVEVLSNPYPLPVPVIITNSVACLNSPLALKGNGGTTYHWDGPAGFSSNNQDAGFTASSLIMNGIYTLSVKNNSNCAASATVMIIVYPQPRGTLTGISSHCIPACSGFTLVPALSGAPLTGHTLQVNNHTLNDTSLYCFISAGIYTASVFFTDTNHCSNTSYFIVNAYDKPKADYNFYPLNPLARSEDVLFTNTSLGEELSTWNWLFTDDTNDTLKTKNAGHLFENPGDYLAVLLVKNKWGCADTMIKAITVIEDFSFYVPDAFTPNGDNINDSFQPKGIGIKAWQLQIIDRWGQQLFSSTDFYNSWNGTFNGKDCPNDVYVWKIDLKLEGGRLKSYTGFVTLVR